MTRWGIASQIPQPAQEKPRHFVEVAPRKKRRCLLGTAKFREETSKKQRAEATLPDLLRYLSAWAQADSFCAAPLVKETVASQ
jgi:hypothetical protein